MPKRAVVRAHSKGSNLGLAGAGQHPVISRAGQCRTHSGPLCRALSFHSHTAAHWNPTLSVSSIYISATNTSLSGGKGLALEMGMWLKNKSV